MVQRGGREKVRGQPVCSLAGGCCRACARTIAYVPRSIPRDQSSDSKEQVIDTRWVHCMAAGREARRKGREDEAEERKNRERRREQAQRA